MEIKLHNNHFQLLPQRAIYWKEQGALILSDLHIGKGMHFRKEGIPVPRKLFDEDLNVLNDIINEFHPVSLIIVGDMFHSNHNAEISIFDIWRVQYDELKIILVRGNHDILSSYRFKEMGILVQDFLEINGFAFSHSNVNNSGKFCFSGHLHPGVRLDGKGRQSIKLPCFHFTPLYCTLPAFSKFTGLATIRPSNNDRVFAILEGEVHEL